MGLFDVFRGAGRNKGEKGAEKPKATPESKWAERAGDKRAQNYDRQEAIAALAEMGTGEAAAALLRRFTFVMDPSITDQEEKNAAFEGILRAGSDAVEPVRAFAAKAESLAWPMRILKELLSDDDYVEELLVWLARWDTEYAKFVDPKVQLLVALEEHKHERIREAVERFLEDVHEPSRFHAATTLLAQDDDSSVTPLVRLLADEESLRVRTRIADGLAARGWTVPDELRDEARKALPRGYVVNGEGRVAKHG